MKKRQRGPKAKPRREVRRGSVIGFQVSEKDRQIVERRAKAKAMAVSDYLRYAVMVEGAMEGDHEVITLMGSLTRDAMVRWLEQLLTAKRQEAESERDYARVRAAGVPDEEV